MTHATQDELIDFAYGELPTERRAAVEAHVASCDECRQKIAAWGAARSELAAWSLPDQVVSKVAPSRNTGVALRWAAAAAVLIGAGYGLARATAPATLDPSALRAQIVQELRVELASQQASFAANESQRRRSFETSVVQEMTDLEMRRLTAEAALRKDVETVAIRTQAGFQHLAMSNDARP